MHFTDDVVIGLDQTDKEQFAYARNYFSRLKPRHEILWNDVPGLRSISTIPWPGQTFPRANRARDEMSGIALVTRLPARTRMWSPCMTAIS